MNQPHLRLTKHLIIPVPMKVAEAVAFVAGVALVALPVAAFAKVITNVPEPDIRPLPLPHVETAAAPREVDERELDCLANNIYFESRNQSDFGQLAIGLVTLTRVQQNRWSDSVCDVVHAPKQFTWTWDGKQKRASNQIDHQRYLDSLYMASRILYGDFDNLLPMFNADHYHTTKVRPSWAKKMERLAVIEDHIFLVDKK